MVKKYYITILKLILLIAFGAICIRINPRIEKYVERGFTIWFIFVDKLIETFIFVSILKLESFISFFTQKGHVKICFDQLLYSIVLLGILLLGYSFSSRLAFLILSDQLIFILLHVAFWHGVLSILERQKE